MLPLKTTLMLNGISSGTTGIGLFLFAKPISQLFGVSNTDPFTAVGLFLIGFGIFVIVTSLGEPLNDKLIRLITALDLLWVLGSIAVIGLYSTSLSVVGTIAIVAVAIWVAVMAFLQWNGLRSGHTSITNQH